MSETQLRNQTRFGAQGTHIFSALDGIIKKLKNEGIAADLVNDLARDHKTRNANFSKEKYDVCFQ